MALALRKGSEAVEEAENPTVADWLTIWVNRKVSEGKAPKTIANAKEYQAKITALLGAKLVSDLKVRHVEEAMKGLTTYQALKFRSHLRDALHEAMRAEIVTRNVAALTEAPRHRPKPKAILTPEVMAAVIDAETNPVHRALWLFLAIQGARPFSEATPLEWGQIIESEGLLWYRGAKTEAGHRPRPIDPRLTPILESIRKEGCPFVFPSEAGTELGKRNVSRAWAAALARVEAPHVRLYSLRSFTVTQLIEAGKDRGLAAALVGHSSEAITSRYYEMVRESRLADEMRRRG